jgi:hypothetical protein
MVAAKTSSNDVWHRGFTVELKLGTTPTREVFAVSNTKLVHLVCTAPSLATNCLGLITDARVIQAR